MTLEEKLAALLLPICPRTFPDFAPPDTAMPYVTWTQIGGVDPTCLDNTELSKENAFIQIEVWSLRRTEAKATIKQIASALTQATGFQACSMGASVGDAVADMKRYSSRQDFSIWSDR